MDNSLENTLEPAKKPGFLRGTYWAAADFMVNHGSMVLAALSGAAAYDAFAGINSLDSFITARDDGLASLLTLGAQDMIQSYRAGRYNPRDSVEDSYALERKRDELSSLVKQYGSDQFLRNLFTGVAVFYGRGAIDSPNPLSIATACLVGGLTVFYIYQAVSDRKKLLEL